jgi:hypothetical protein
MSSHQRIRALPQRWHRVLRYESIQEQSLVVLNIHWRNECVDYNTLVARHGEGPVNVVSHVPNSQNLTDAVVGPGNVLREGNGGGKL